jgi:hypothetical protein
MSGNIVVLPNRGDYFTVDGERPVLAAPGLYALRYMRYETARLHGGRAGKVIAWFNICEMGTHFGQSVPAYYNASVPSAKRQAGGRFKVGWRSRLMREYALVEGLPARTDRIRLDLLGRHLLEGRLETVTHGHDRRAIPADVQYSVVAEITRVIQRSM